MLSFSGVLSLRDAGDLRLSLLAALSGSSEVRVDVSGLVSADLTILQVLVAARRSALAAGKEVLLVGVGPGLHDGLRAAGFMDGNGNIVTPEGDFWLGRAAA
jgi:anti-anti-sigma regulatory factor